MRRMAALLLCLALLLGGCAPRRAAGQRFSRTYYDVFDTVITLTCLAEDEAAFADAAAEFEALLRRLDGVFDRYEPHAGVAGLWALNAAAGEWVAVEPELFELLEACAAWRALDGGRVNIALGGVLELWREYREAGEALPPLAALQRAAAHADPDAIELDAAGGRVRLRDAEMQIDLGAVAKGWSVARLAELLDARCPDYLIDAGGNVRAGTRALDGGDAWRVGIADPAQPGSVLLVLELTGLSAVTSGGYQRYYELDGVRYHHLIDPDTLMPADFVAQVTILTADSGLADYLSTAVFLLPLEAGRALIEGLDGVEAIWVLNDGEIQMTEGAAALCKDR